MWYRITCRLILFVLVPHPGCIQGAFLWMTVPISVRRLALTSGMLEGALASGLLEGAFLGRMKVLVLVRRVTSGLLEEAFPGRMKVPGLEEDRVQ